MSDFIDDSSPYYIIKYVFKYEGAEDLVVPIKLKKDTLELDLEGKAISREWTKLNFNKCSCCPLNEADHPECPAAMGMSTFLEKFANNISHVDTKVAVITPERTYYKETSLQNGIYGIMGLVLATSGCPIFHPLKPMARFHLPFSTVDETLARALSFYLLKRYFQHKRGEEIDPTDMNDLDQTYANIDKVNQGLYHVSEQPQQEMPIKMHSLYWMLLKRCWMRPSTIILKIWNSTSSLILTIKFKNCHRRM
ncbi:MAG: hypothetical protein R2827_15850 [Bdellovibrionales bacterium]